jgi:opacity protein-like surface antigen
MKKVGFFAALTGVLFGANIAADAATYPVYTGYQGTNATGNVVMLPTAGGVVMPTTNPNVAMPTRITGSLPRVGSNSNQTTTVAGRQYYQPADFDRLADSGLYVGLSVGYSASISGGMIADYMNEDGGQFVPGAFQEAGFNTDTVIPLQLSVGASINNDLRVDFGYLRYSGLAYPSMVQSADGIGGYVDATVDGGAITSNATMLNLYYNIDAYTGYLAGGMLRPYVGVGVGIALNTIADYVVYDGTFYSEMEPSVAGPGDITGISDVYAYHNGGTTEQLAFMFEGGLTTELDGGIKIDFFVRYSNLGKVKTSGSIVLSQTQWLGDGAGGEYPNPYDSVYHYTNWYESGRLSTIDLGLRLRLQF